MTDFIEIAAQPGTILGDLLEDPTIESFKEMITPRMGEIKKTLHDPQIQNSAYVGATIIHQLIVDKLKQQKKKNNKKRDNGELIEYSIDIHNRLEYFKSEKFIDNFLKKLPVTDNLNMKVAHASYTNFFNDLFDLPKKEFNWRKEIEENTKAVRQCAIAFNEPWSVDLATKLLEKKNIICYLCGRKITPLSPDDPAMECEHILSVVTALSHFWMITDKEIEYSDEMLNYIKLEYDWSHRCCNRYKSDTDFILYDTVRNSFVPDEVAINDVLDKIEGKHVDLNGHNQKKFEIECSNIEGRVDPLQHRTIVKSKIMRLLEIINKNLRKFNTIDEYLLLTKFKLLSAFTSEKFLKVISAKGKTIAIPKDKKQIVKEKTQVIVNSMPEERLTRAYTKYRDTIRVRSSGRLTATRQQGGANEDENWERLEKEFQEKYPDEYYDTINEFIDTEFPEIQDKISPYWHIPQEALDLADPEYILTNEAFNPTQAEFLNKLNELFIPLPPNNVTTYVPVLMKTGTTTVPKRLRDTDNAIDDVIENNIDIQQRKFVRVRGGKSKRIRTRKSKRLRTRKSRKIRKNLKN